MVGSCCHSPLKRQSETLWAVGLAVDAVRSKSSEYILEVELVWIPGELGVRETVVSRMNPRFLTWAIKWMMVLFTEILKKWGENARKCQSMLQLD